MLSGRQTLGSIDQALREQLQKLKSADGRLAAMGEQLLDIQKSDVEHFRDLARERVDYIASDEMLSSFDDTDQQVLKLLEHRKAAARELERELEQLEQSRDALEQQRAEQAEALEQISDRIDQEEAKSQQRLDTDPDYQYQRKRAGETERIARHAEEKAARSEQEQEHKGRAYQDDPLFCYLWQRHFGTTEYQANPLARSLDRWVAGLISYGDARANYSRLNELPLRLREHAEQCKLQAGVEYQRLQEIDAEARISDGIPALEAEEISEQEKLQAIDVHIEELANQHRQLLERKERFGAGNDRDYQTIVDQLAAEFSRDDLQQLRREAMLTPYPDDDLIVERILDNEQKKQDLEQSRKDIKQLSQQHRKRLQELESLRSEYKQRRYDDPRSGFADGAVVGMVLNNFLEGMLNSDSVWDVLQKQQRQRPRRVNPDFGSGGFGRGSMWGSRGKKRSGGGFGRRSGGGGFRTGGGF